jgi:drug/metabolite transporter (DMT)-like permease
MTARGGALSILGAALSWGATAAAAKALLNRSFDPFLLSQARVTTAAVLLVTGLLVLRPAALRVRGGDLWRFALLGIAGMAGAQATLYLTMQASTVATGIVLQYCAPVLVLVYGRVTGTERVSLRKTLAALAAVAGCVVTVTGSDPGALLLNSRAVGFGVASACCFAFLTVYARPAGRGYDPLTVTACATSGAAFFWILVRPAASIDALGSSPSVLLVLTALGIGSVLIPYLLYFRGLRVVPPGRAIVLATLEPVVAILAAEVFLGERLDILRAAGAAVVVVSITVLQLRNDSPAPPIADASAPQ